MIKHSITDWKRFGGKCKLIRYLLSDLLNEANALNLTKYKTSNIVRALKHIDTLKSNAEDRMGAEEHHKNMSDSDFISVFYGEDNRIKRLTEAVMVLIEKEDWDLSECCKNCKHGVDYGESVEYIRCENTRRSKYVKKSHRCALYEEAANEFHTP